MEHRGLQEALNDTINDQNEACKGQTTCLNDDTIEDQFELSVEANSFSFYKFINIELVLFLPF